MIVRKCYLNFGMMVQILNQNIIDSLFNKFNKGYKGEFGLGLAIVYRIVNLHGGKIWVQNEEEGVSFQIEIPN